MRILNLITEWNEYASTNAGYIFLSQQKSRLKTIYFVSHVQVASAGGKILVHCVAGISRSASLCIAYLMKHHEMTLLNAYNHIKERRPSIKPNCGFFRQLIDYESKLFNCNSVRVVYNEFLNLEIPDVYDAQYRYYDYRNYRKKSRDISSRR